MNTPETKAPSRDDKEDKEDGDVSGKSAGHASSEDERRMLWVAAPLAIVLGLALYYGFIVDRSIRPDPFTPNPGFWTWFAYGQPDERLAKIPVVPIGARGSLTFRPKDTGWINSPYVPDEVFSRLVLDELPPSAPSEQPTQQQPLQPQTGQQQPLQQQTVQQQIDQQQLDLNQLDQKQPELNQLDQKQLDLNQLDQKQTNRKQTNLKQIEQKQPDLNQLDQKQAVQKNAAQEQTVEQSTSGNEVPSAIIDAVISLKPEDLAAPLRGAGHEKRMLNAECDFSGDHCRLGLEHAVLILSDGRIDSPAASVMTSIGPNPSLNLMQGANALFPPLPFDEKRPHELEMSSLERRLVGGRGQSIWIDPGSLKGGLAFEFASRVVDARGESKSGVLLPNSDPPDVLTAAGIKSLKNSEIQRPALHNRGFVDFTLPAFGNLNYGVSTGSESTVWMVGDAGSIFQLTGPDSVDVTSIVSNTTANLRSIYFQKGYQIGWVSSGWGEDSDDPSKRPVILATTDGGVTWERLSYRALPAPWLLYLTVPAFMIAFYGAAVSGYRVYTTPEPALGVEGMAIPDRPIGWSDVDVLGLKPRARAIQRFLRNHKTEPPLTIAVTGPWGSGKSSLMNLIAEDLARLGARPVWFNAWHHQTEDNMLAALLENIRVQAIPPIWTGSGLWFRLRLISNRGGGNIWGLFALLALLVFAYVLLAALLPHFWQQISPWLTSLMEWVSKPDSGGAAAGKPDAQDSADGLSALTTLLTGALGLGTAGAAVAGLLQLVSHMRTLSLSPARLMATISERASVSQFTNQLSFRHVFAKQFRDVCRAMRWGSNAGLVIFIDDLDRCEADKVMQVLESVNFLVTAGPCFIFLGIDKARVADAINAKLNAGKDPEYAEKYLRKLFNVVVPVPATTDASAVALTKALIDPPDRSSLWPDRIRRALRLLPDIVTPPLALLLLSLVLTGMFAVEQPKQPQASPAEEATTAPPPNSEAPAAPQNPSAESATPAAPAAQPSAETEAPVIAASELQKSVPWLPWAIPVTVVILIGLTALRRTTLAKENDVDDSPAFERAVEFWHPLIYASDPTPRGIKRHQNRLRFHAMSLRPLEGESDWLDRMFTKQTPPAAVATVSDDLLVALGAIDAFAPEVLDAGPENIDARLSKSIETRIAAPPQGAPEELRKKYENIRSICTRCKADFPNSWPPSADQIALFRGLGATNPKPAT